VPSIIGGIFYMFFLPETKGLNLEEVAAAFGDVVVSTEKGDKDEDGREHRHGSCRRCAEHGGLKKWPAAIDILPVRSLLIRCLMIVLHLEESTSLPWPCVSIMIRGRKERL
jgi:hypothetical protein